MKICAIIAEYNPFTNGHLYHITKAKAETACDTLIVLLSGSFTNHGESCVADKLTRANWAMQAGADCVIELPVVYSLSSPRIYSLGALKTLKPFGNFTLSFGSDLGNIEYIENAVDYNNIENKEFKTLFNSFMMQTVSKAEQNLAAKNSKNTNDKKSKNARNNINDSSKTFNEELSTQVENQGKSNDILAVEYIKAARELKMDIDFHTVKIFESANSENFSSAHDIRKKMKENINISKSVPPFVAATSPNYSKLDAICLYALNTKSAEQLSEIANVSGGLENRLKKNTFNSMNEVYSLASKNLTKSDIKRTAVCATLSLNQNLVDFALNSKPYYRILKIRNDRKDILDYISSFSKNLFLEPEDCSQKNKLRALIDIDEKAAKLLSLIK